MDLAWRLAKLVGTTSVEEVTGGHQSQVFETTRSSQRLVIKVRDASTVDSATLRTQVGIVAELGAIDPLVCGPVPLDGALVTTLDGDSGWAGYATCYEYAAGEAPNQARPADAALMGSALARLHQMMRRIERKPLPLVAALGAVHPDWNGPTQLLHGDFNAGNVRCDGGIARVFDFDDCGYGPPAFDVANALYMVLFDDMTSRRTRVYPCFREAFLDGYISGTRPTFELDDVRGLIDLRVAALQSWLDEPETAPIGIRNSPPAWHQTLQGFVHQYRDEF